MKKETFAAGCFWRLEEVMPGYAGGGTEGPDYVQRYCALVMAPKIMKIEKVFGNRLKDPR